MDPISKEKVGARKGKKRRGRGEERGRD